MLLRRILFLAVLASGSAFEITDEEYHQMPKLFELDNYERCLASPEGVFCLGTFDLLPYKNDELLKAIQTFSSNKYHFNHTHIHRGLCLPNTCRHIPDSSAKTRFATCVGDSVRSQYGLETNLTRFEYCKTGDKTGRKVDTWDIAFACVTAVIVVSCLVGTAYEAFQTGDKPNRFLIAWSLTSNWRRLVTDHSDGDPRLSALKPIQGMKSMTLLLVMLAHSVFAYHISYVYNPQFLEKASHDVPSAYFQNGTSIVQTFIMASNFLLTYNLLLYVEKNPKKQLSLTLFPQCLMHRITRITPVYLFVLGAASSWLSHISDGPLWTPLIEAECDRCRQKLWSHLLYINNFYKPDLRCFVHTWFLAVDMQLYIVCAVLVLSIGKWPKTAMKVTAALFFASILANLAIVMTLKLKPMVALMFPEYMHEQFVGEKSFRWLYAAPWDSLPSALVGALAALAHRSLQLSGYEPQRSMLFRIAYRTTLPLMFLWVVAGYFVKTADMPWVGLYAVVDRPIFISMTAFVMYGFINKVDYIWWKFLSWRGFEILGRMSLSIYLVHWLYGLTQVAMRSHLTPASIHEIGGHFLYTAFITYMTAVPLYLFVELPLQKFLQAIIS